MIIHIHGAGPSGCTAARLLADRGHKIIVFEKRSHIAGNTYDELVGDTLIHKYGPHLFHTNSDIVVDFLSRFTSFTDYKHTVKARTIEGLIDMPLVDTRLDEDTSVVNHPESTKWFNLVYKWYSLKQWGYIPPKEVLNRVMIKCQPQKGYFTDKYQGLPKDGYTRMFESMLDHPNISVILSHTGNLSNQCNLRIWTGPIDTYYNYKHGALKYRSLDFKLSTEDTFIEAPTVNECTLDKPYTRTTSYGLIMGTDSLLVQREYPSDYVVGKNEPYYPMKDTDLLSKYQSEPYDGTIFIGRLAEYKYLDMDKAILNTMNIIDEILI